MLIIAHALKPMFSLSSARATKNIQNFKNVQKSHFFPKVVHGLKKIRRRLDNIVHALLIEHLR